MARPQKQTVDYFPHDVGASESKTLYILQNKYGNDGYAFWFKLLELLGSTAGHYYCFNNPADWEFLSAKTHVPETVIKEILVTLVNLNAIDRELFNRNVIWCQKFVDRLSDVYARRNDKPQKPNIDNLFMSTTLFDNNNVTDNNNHITTDNKHVTTFSNTQSKLKETKLNILPPSPSLNKSPDNQVTRLPDTGVLETTTMTPEQKRQQLSRIANNIKKQSDLSAGLHNLLSGNLPPDSLDPQPDEGSP